MRTIWLPLPLLLLLLMAPQILETLYSPALTDISHAYGVSATAAGQTLSIYFLAFAFGVLFWGRCSDHIGRRKAMLAGLIVYLGGALLALASSPHFEWLLAARLLTAFGAAVGSVVTQIMLRDVFHGPALGKLFASMGMALALSPMIGLASGGFLVELGSVTAVFLGQLGLALILLLWGLKALPETQPEQAQAHALPLSQVASRMLRDPHIACSVLLVSGFNVMVFAYFALAPFAFAQMGLSQQQFGYTGALLALASLAGAALNRRLLAQQVPVLTQIYLGAALTLIAALLLLWRPHSLWLLPAAMLVMLAFGLAIPNILSQALVRYRDALGTASALFGLAYYLVIAAGLHLAALGQNLGLTLLSCSLLALLACFGLGRSQAV
ncbi:MAG: MFS transporter [Neisseriaceae bacterium]|nr:MFS transporter [Neisseriaceae bacterium]MBP6861658.1 MFS transporter [Neisseriaceae bacterium]